MSAPSSFPFTSAHTLSPADWSPGSRLGSLADCCPPGVRHVSELTRRCARLRHEAVSADSAKFVAAAIPDIVIRLHRDGGLVSVHRVGFGARFDELDYARCGQ